MTGLAAPLALGVLLGAGLWLCSSVFVAMRNHRLSDRVAPRVARVSRAAFMHAVEGAQARGGYRFLLHSTARFIPVSRDSLARRLVWVEQGVSEASFRQGVVVRCALGLGVGVGTGGLVVMLGSGVGSSAGVIAGAALICALAFATWPFYQLRRAVRSVHRDLDGEIAAVLGFLAVAVAGGETLPHAVTRVSRIGSGRLCRELARVTQEVAWGQQFGIALTTIADRTGHAATSRALASIATALATGAPVASVLREEVDALQATRSRLVIERASRQEVGMLVPLVFMILPVTVLFAVFPGIAAVQSTFS